MSNSAAGWAWDLDIEPEKKLLAITLADGACNDGGRFSIRELSIRCSMNCARAIDDLAWLEARGILTFGRRIGPATDIDADINFKFIRSAPVPKVSTAED